MADWYIKTCEDLGKELIKAGTKSLQEAFEFDPAGDGFIWDEDNKVLSIPSKLNTTKDEVFQELLDEWVQLKEDKVDHSYSGAAWQYQKISDQYKEWEKKYKEAN